MNRGAGQITGAPAPETAPPSPRVWSRNSGEIFSGVPMAYDPQRGWWKGVSDADDGSEDLLAAGVRRPGALRGVCDRCGYDAERERKRRHDARRASARQRGYDSTWERVRRLVLQEEPLCRLCKAEGLIEPATEVDHIVPMANGGARLDRANLQPLCRKHHSRKTATEDSSFARR
jgi:5-methylcytosine-specific restriction protein A